MSDSNKYIDYLNQTPEENFYDITMIGFHPYDLSIEEKRKILLDALEFGKTQGEIDIKGTIVDPEKSPFQNFQNI